MDLSNAQQMDLTALYYGAFLVHSRGDDAWYLYSEGETADQVDAEHAERYVAHGWVERQGFESSVDLELYALTSAGQETIEPYLEAEAEAGDSEPGARLLLAATAGERDYLLSVPLTPGDLETLRRRFVLAETLSAADDDFVALEYGTDVSAYDAELGDEIRELRAEARGAALLATLPDDFAAEAELTLSWASVLVSESGFAYAAGTAGGERLETDELTEDELMTLAMTLLTDEPLTQA